MIIEIDNFLSYIEEYLRESVITQEYQIEVGEWINENPVIAAKGWVGIYHQDIEYTPRTLGRSTQSWQGNLHIAVIVQNADFKSGEECTLELQRRVKNVVSTFADGVNASSFVDVIRSLDISFSYISDESETVYFQNATLDFVLAFSGEL